MRKAKQGVIHWRSNLTGQEGHGDAQDIDSAKLWAGHLNKKWKGSMEHRVVPIGGFPLALTMILLAAAVIITLALL